MDKISVHSLQQSKIFQSETKVGVEHVSSYLEAFPGTVVTPVGRVGVGVAAAVAGLTGIAHLQRVAVVTVGTSGNFGRDKKKRM